MMFSQLQLLNLLASQFHLPFSKKWCGIIFLAVSMLVFIPASHAQKARLRNGLAPVMTDSFVRQAGESADLIYGDESPAAGRGEMNGGPPPFYGFSEAHRIESGIVGQRADGLTTGHGSYMPSAWGRDEFLGAEWSQAGASNEKKREEFAFVIPQQ